MSADGQEYDVERLLNKRIIKKGRGLATEYLLRWRGYGLEFDRWYNIKDLQDALELVQEYDEEAHRIKISDSTAATTVRIACNKARASLSRAQVKSW